MGMARMPGIYKMNTLAFVGFHDGMQSICIADEHSFDGVPAELVNIAHMMAMEAMLADDAKFDRVIYPTKSIRMRTSELVRISEV